MDKKVKKLFDKECYFCHEKDYSLLDVHRICEGKDGGKYTEFNTITCCCACHRKIHSGQIKTIRKYYSSSGKYVLHYEKDGEIFFN